MNLETIDNKIVEVRGMQVMLDFDLAVLYEVETRVLKQAVNRNKDRFPSDFMFQLTLEEYQSLRSQTVILNEQGRGKHSKYAPYAFTEQGVAMLSSVLRSKKALQVNIGIMRAFVLIRKHALSHKDLTEQLKQLENKYDQQFKDVFEAISFLLKKEEKNQEQAARQEIGYKSIKK